MLRSLIAVFLMLGVAFGGVPASAADLGGGHRGSLKDEAPYAPRFNWTGGYVGLQLGWAWAETDARSGTIAAFDQTYGYDYEAVIGGGHAGYNFQVGQIVYGIEADLEFSDLNAVSVGSLGDLHQTEVNWLGSLRARIGYAASQNALIYVTGGWAFADTDITSDGLSYSDWRNGWTLGAGFEYAFTRNMTARLEYRYTDFGESGARSVALDAKDETDLTAQAIRAGISFKF